MKKILSLILILCLLACGAAAAEEAGTKISGKIEDGCYVLSVELKPGESGEWRADDMAQDPSVVKLAASGEESGVYTARYEPAGDGDVAVTLRHKNEHGVCDELHLFELHVKDGKIAEATGGSYTASPREEDLDPHFSGEWLEKDTQFTLMDVTKKIGDGWDIEIMSPVSHGAWLIRATVYFDCVYDGFVYEDGVKYNLSPEDGSPAEKTAEDMWGVVRFTGTEENVQLEWYDMQSMEGETVVFERAPGLPAYVYPGDDPVEGAVANALANKFGAENYLTEQGYVTIPCPIIHKTEMTDETHMDVYGSFWVLNYVKRGLCLMNISGGEYAAVMTLEKDGDGWRMTAVDLAGDGDDYPADIARFAAGDAGLEEKYFAGADLGTEENREIRTRFIREYVEANSLGVTAYQDYGWDPVPLK